MWTIYCYQNMIDGKRYIGVTNKTKASRSGKGGVEYIRQNKKFGDAIIKYGWDNFDYSVLDIEENEYVASEKERYYIALYKSYDSNYGYNGNKGGCVPTEKRVVQYSRNGEKLREYESVCLASQECGIGSALIIQSCKQQIKLAGGYIWRYEAQAVEKLKNISITPFSGERGVLQLDKNGNIIATYDSAKDAEKKTGALRSKICMCCRGQRKTAGGFGWRYAEECKLKDIYNPRPAQVYRVRQYDLDNNLIAEFSSQNDAHRKTGFSASMIGECCRGIRDVACGFIWKYVN